MGLGGGGAMGTEARDLRKRMRPVGGAFAEKVVLRKGSMDNRGLNNTDLVYNMEETWRRILGYMQGTERSSHNCRRKNCDNVLKMTTPI